MKKGTFLPPFKRLCVTIGNLPSSYVDSMSYYECLMWLCKYLKETVIPAINNNAQAVNEIEHWIETLDLQDEVNKKLDEMAESGELTELIASYLQTNAIIGFNTVADLKLSENLINGSYAKTLGYHTLNDGGGATYKIRNITNDDVIDESFIIELADDNLVAELIIDGVIYANQLGADNTGTVDSSTILNNAFNKINSNWLNDIKVNTLVLNGIYKVDNRLNMPPCAKLRTNGLTKIISSVINDSTLFIHYLSNELPTNNEEKHRYISGELINGESGLIITSSLDKATSNSIAIEIGDRSDLGTSYSLSKYVIKNVTINNYTIGILHNSYNVYLGHCEKLHLENNTTNIQFGKISQVSSWANSGERMSFENCLIGSSSYGVKFEGIYWYTFFNNCSFDFNADTFYQSVDTTLYGNEIRVNNSHFEGFNRITNNFTQNQELINICNSFIYNSSHSTNLFVNLGNPSSEPTYVTLDNTILHMSGITSLSAENYVILNQSPILHNTKLTRVDLKEQYFWNNNLVNNFDNIEDGTVSIADNQVIGDFKVIGRSGLDSSATIVTDNALYTGHKSLLVTRTGTNAPTLLLESGLIPLKDEKIILNTLLMYNFKGITPRCLIKFYDKNENLIKYKSTYEYLPSRPETNTWSVIPAGNFDKVPANASYFQLLVTVQSIADDSVGTQYKLGGIISNSR